MPRSSCVVGVTIAVLSSLAACRAPVRAPAPLALEEHHCWWAVFRTTLPPDSVAVHFVHAFVELGLRGGAWAQRGDTTWAHADPTRLPDWYGGTFSARVVAFRSADSTHFRHFIDVAPPPGGWPAAHDSLTADGRHIAIDPAGSTIGFCGALGQAARVHGTAPRDPDGEEKLPIWTSTPRED